MKANHTYDIDGDGVADSSDEIYGSYFAWAPTFVAMLREKIGSEKAGSLIENAMGSIAKALVDSGVRRLVVAGGETAGAVVGALGISSLQIGEQIDPGVPGTITVEDPKIALALKSGNFGEVDFFQKALDTMP